MSRFFFAWFLLSSALAGAQTPVVSTTIESKGETTIGPAACGTALTVTWNVTLVRQACSDLTLWTSKNSCGDTPDTAQGDKTYGKATLSRSITTLQTGTFEVNVDDLPPLQGSDAGVVCGSAEKVELKTYLCASYEYGTGSLDPCSTKSVQTNTETGTVLYDTLPPNKPTITSVDGYDTQLQVAVNAPGAARLIFVLKNKADEKGEEKVGDPMPVSGSGYRLKELTNEVTYLVQVKALDDAGNESELSDAKEGTPLQTDGFWEVYAAANGSEQGCAAAPGGLFALAGLAWFASRRRR